VPRIFFCNYALFRLCAKVGAPAPSKLWMSLTFLFK
jgi:hypothetical protein